MTVTRKTHEMPGAETVAIAPRAVDGFVPDAAGVIPAASLSGSVNIRVMMVFSLTGANSHDR
jgi:hypothetical protein